MKHFLVLSVLVCTTCAIITNGEAIPGAIKITADDALPPTRRQGISYTTSVLHQDPNRPDQHAESSVNVNFNNQRNPTIQTISIAQPQKYIRPSQYDHNVPLNSHTNLKNIEDIPNAQTTHHYSNAANFYKHPQTQSFDVGYSVRFNNDPTVRNVPRQQVLDSGEIITGSRNTAVKKPVGDFDADEFVSNALIDLKRQKVSGIKPKFQKFPVNKDTDDKNFITNLAPKTQRYLSYLGPPKLPSKVFRQPVQPTEVLNAQGSWTNLSPSVEIYRSTEVANESDKQLNHLNEFDHTAALLKSQGFEYGNTLEGGSDTHQQLGNVFQLSPDATALTINTLPFSGTFQQGNYEHSLQNGKNQESVIQSFQDVGGVPTENEVATFVHNMPLVMPTLRTPSKNTDFQDFTKHLTVLQSQSPNSAPKINIHHNLFSNQGTDLPGDFHTVAIPFDSTLLDAMQQQAVPQIKDQLENLHESSVQGLKQDYGTGDVQQHQEQQFNTYRNKEFEKYYNYYLNNIKSQKNNFETIPEQRPNKRVRFSKDIEMQTDLRPPPLNISRRRRMFVGK